MHVLSCFSSATLIFIFILFDYLDGSECSQAALKYRICIDQCIHTRLCVNVCEREDIRNGVKLEK